MEEDWWGPPVLIFGLPGGEVMAFGMRGSAESYLTGLLYLGWRLVACGVPAASLRCYTLDGQRLRIRRSGLLRSPVLVPGGEQARDAGPSFVDDVAAAAQRLGLAGDADAIDVANALLREDWEQLPLREGQLEATLPRWVKPVRPPGPAPIGPWWIDRQTGRVVHSPGTPDEP